MFVKFFQNGTSFSFPVRYINKITRYRLVAALRLYHFVHQNLKSLPKKSTKKYPILSNPNSPPIIVIYKSN